MKSIVSISLAVAMMIIFVATATYAQTTQQVLRVTRVYVDRNSLPTTVAEMRRRRIRQDGTAQTLQFYSRNCETTFPTVKNIQNVTTGAAATCNSMPLSLFVVPTSGTCNAASCSIYNTDIGGGLGGGFGPGQIPAPGSGSLPQFNSTNQYVSITTYTALESSPGSTVFPGQAATGQTLGVAYCPGSAGITSSFIFQSGACILSPKANISTTTGGNSTAIYSNYRAFYALCNQNNGLLIKGCVDEVCQNCFVISDTSGCVQYSPQALTGYINYQGCGIGRASN